jgi:hypothetical protein
MNRLLREISIKARLYGFGAMCLAAVLLSAAALLGTGNRLETSASGVFETKDLVADLLPPPLYLVELRLVVSRTVEGSLSAEEAAREVARLQGEYAARVAHWGNSPVDGLSEQALSAQAESAETFLAAARGAVAVAREQGAEAAREKLAGLDTLFAAHRTGVDALVKQANALAAGNITRFERTVAWAKALAWAGG